MIVFVLFIVSLLWCFLWDYVICELPFAQIKELQESDKDNDDDKNED